MSGMPSDQIDLSDCSHRLGEVCSALLAVPLPHEPVIPSIFSGEMLDLVAEIIS